MNRYSGYTLAPPAVPIRFQKLLKIVAIVDAQDLQTRELLAQIAAEGYEIQTTDRYDRDVAEDASVGA